MGLFDWLKSKKPVPPPKKPVVAKPPSKPKKMKAPPKKKSSTTSDSIVQPKGATQQSTKAKSSGKATDLQKRIDATSAKGVLTLDANLGEYQGPVTIRKSIKIIGKKHVIWAKKGPVLSVEKGEADLQNISIEITISDHSKLSEEETVALAVMPSAKIKTDQVLVRGNVQGVPGEEGIWDYPTSLNLGILRPNVKHEFKIELLIPIACKIKCDISGLAFKTSKPVSSSTALSLVLDPFPSGVRLRGKITIESGLLTRQIPVNGNIADSKSKKAITGKGQLIWKPQKSTQLDLANQIVNDLNLKKSEVIEFGSSGPSGAFEFAEFLEISDKGMIKLRSLTQESDAMLQTNGKSREVRPEDFEFKRVEFIVLPNQLAKREGWKTVKLPQGPFELKTWNATIAALTREVRVDHSNQFLAKMDWQENEVIQVAEKPAASAKGASKSVPAFEYGLYLGMSDTGLIQYSQLEQKEDGTLKQTRNTLAVNLDEHDFQKVANITLPESLAKQDEWKGAKFEKGPFTKESWNDAITKAKPKIKKPAPSKPPLPKKPVKKSVPKTSTSTGPQTIPSPSSSKSTNRQGRRRTKGVGDAFSDPSKEAQTAKPNTNSTSKSSPKPSKPKASPTPKQPPASKGTSSPPKKGLEGTAFDAADKAPPAEPSAKPSPKTDPKTSKPKVSKTKKAKGVGKLGSGNQKKGKTKNKKGSDLDSFWAT